MLAAAAPTLLANIRVMKLPPVAIAVNGDSNNIKQVANNPKVTNTPSSLLFILIFMPLKIDCSAS